jgi:hypothetical protein
MLHPAGEGQPGRRGERADAEERQELEPDGNAGLHSL